MKHSKILLVAFVSGFVAITTALLGVTGTIIGSVLSSVLYNVISEFLEEPFQKSRINKNYEWEIMYIFPLVVIAIIQLLLILAFLSEWGFLPNTFLTVYLSLQDIAGNNLYRILGASLLVLSVYPFILKPDIIKKSHGFLIACIGLVFLARGFVDLQNFVGRILDVIFDYFDFPIEVIAFILLCWVIFRIMESAKNSNKSLAFTKKEEEKITSKSNHQSRKEPTKIVKKRKSIKNNNKHVSNKINESVEDISFESNDLWSKRR